MFQRTNAEGYAQFRGVTRVRSSLGGFVALFSDVEAMGQWMYRTEEVRRLEVLGPRELYAYTRNDLPWPLSDRDAVLHVRIRQDPASHVVEISADSVPGRVPPREGVVRMPLVRSRWVLTPLREGEIEVVFEGYGDPGGTLGSRPFSWFYELALWEAPYETLAGMRELIGRPRYQSARSEVVEEP